MFLPRSGQSPSGAKSRGPFGDMAQVGTLYTRPFFYARRPRSLTAGARGLLLEGCVTCLAGLGRLVRWPENLVSTGTTFENTPLHRIPFDDLERLRVFRWGFGELHATSFWKKNTRLRTVACTLTMCNKNLASFLPKAYGCGQTKRRYTVQNPSQLFEKLAGLLMKQARFTDEVNGLESDVVQSKLRFSIPIERGHDTITKEVSKGEQKLLQAKIGLSMNAREIAELFTKVGGIIQAQSGESAHNPQHHTQQQ